MEQRTTTRYRNIPGISIMCICDTGGNGNGFPGGGHDFDFSIGNLSLIRMQRRGLKLIHVTIREFGARVPVWSHDMIFHVFRKRIWVAV